MLRPLFFVLWIASLPSLAEEPLPPPTPPPAAAEAGCFPACRSGYQCSAGVCTSVCNPPCAPGRQCHQSRCGEPTSAPVPRGVTVNDEGERAPVGQQFETRRKMGLLITGPILFGVGWLGGGAIGFLSYLGSGATARLLNFIPVGGAIGSELVLLGSPGGSDSPTLFGDVVFTGGRHRAAVRRDHARRAWDSQKAGAGR